MLAVPLALTVAILRRGLWQLDLVLDRSLVYGGLTLAVVLVYAALVWLAGSLIDAVGPDLRIAAVVVAAVATAPLRDRLQLGVNRLLYGDRDDPEAAMARLADRLDAATHPTDVLPAVAQGVVRTLRVPWAEVETARGARGAAGTPTGLAVDVPLHYQGRDVGVHARCSARRRVGARGRGSARCSSAWLVRLRWRLTPRRCRRTSSAHGSGWCCPARRSDAGCVATSMTTSAPRSPPPR